jgi:hypothetical protein
MCEVFVLGPSDFFDPEGSGSAGGSGLPVCLRVRGSCPRLGLTSRQQPRAGAWMPIRTLRVERYESPS